MLSKLIRKKKRLQFELDWQFTEWFDDTGEPVSCIKLLTGQFKDLVYYYTSVKVVESPDQDCATIKFGIMIVGDPITFNDRKREQELYAIASEILEQLIQQDHGEYVTPSQHYIGES
jgi:hypothetical protein